MQNQSHYSFRRTFSILDDFTGKNGIFEISGTAGQVGKALKKPVRKLNLT